ncbi:diacylglycerol/lipid kinase family protein [Clostridium hydrogeniformans]|uniref:diacylglycerol/lipid kinase family protein n=1 Tax=Clostridium hydrogeniformans TaxID=349933 RepID=UPI0004836817|nr:diacylglycerol kinase family protein [Clostridium hydrogeniformans]
MKHLFIINPAAGNGKAINYIDEIHKYFKDKNVNYKIKVTEDRGHATLIAKKYSSLHKNLRIYSLGGDGTLNEILNGMACSSASLGVIPCGTGNDFIKSVSKDNSFSDILKNTIEGEEKLIDIALANGRYFLNISSVGLDSEVAYNSKMFKQKRFIPSHMSYFLSLLYTPFYFKSLPLEIYIDNKELKEESMLMAVCNGSFYGGGIPICPDANLSDGKLDICLVKKVSLLKLLRFIPKALKGNHGEAEEVLFYKGRNLKVKSSKNFSLQWDGEILRCNEAEFTIIPNGLKAIIPK